MSASWSAKLGLRCWIDRCLQRSCRQRKAARRLADAEIDAAGRQRREQIEGLGDLVGAVVLQHHAAGADADLRCLGEQIGDQRFRCGTREVRHIVVLGHPETVIAKLLGSNRQPGGRPQRIRRISTGFDGAFVEKAQKIGHIGSSDYRAGLRRRSSSL